jgi:hypothetical protein
MTSKRIQAKGPTTAACGVVMGAIASLAFGACLSPATVDYKEEKVVASAECLKCIARADSPGPGCGDEIADCRLTPSCSKSLDCSLQRGCIGGTVQKLVSCLPDCTRAAGLGGPEDPGRVSGIRVFECLTHGACATVCFTDSGDAGIFPIDAANDSAPVSDAEVGADGGGACLNPADQAAGSDAMTVSDIARNCGIQCFGVTDKACAASCMTRDAGFSPACAACWGNSINCVSENCLAPCLGGAQDPVCMSCTSQFCTPAFRACSGT